MDSSKSNSNTNSNINSNTPDNHSIPSGFRYREVLKKGKPVHDKDDSFSIRHPAMELSRRAKIFTPFDALTGFDEELENARALVAGAYAEKNEPVEEFP